ncbi:MAG: hypothetical protein U0136_21175 [Bdellovibrionota bacterium]
MSRICKSCETSFSVSQLYLNVVAKLGLPAPTLCIHCRQRRRLAYRNERRLYRRNCDLRGNSIVTAYSPDKPFTVYSPDAWWSEDWEPTRSGRDFDFTRPFFDQFVELRNSSPRLSLINTQGQNSDYCHNTLSNKNCYLVFGGDFNQDCWYSILNMHCSDCSDLYWVNKSELVYDSIDCHGCYNVRYAQSSDHCRDSDFLFECRSCADCCGCVGLRSARFCFFNEQLSESDYRARVASLRLDTWSGVNAARERFERFKLSQPHRHAHILSCEGSTGDHLSHLRDAVNCFSVEGPAETLEDCIYSGWDSSRELVSCNNVGVRTELYYECAYCNNGTSCACCIYTWRSHDCAYCDTVMDSKNMFGCASMKRAEYCIFNQQYSRDEYTRLRARIVAHMKDTGEYGEFFPMGSSPWCYNETAANDFYPLTREQANARGLHWMDEDLAPATADSTLPDSINDVGDDILKRVLTCELSGRRFKLIPPELAFYRRHGIPLPRWAPETRDQRRLKMRTGLQTWKRKCARCASPIETTYAPERPEIVYCEECYHAHVQG